jgi:hypothetical protein
MRGVPPDATRYRKDLPMPDYPAYPPAAMTTTELTNRRQDLEHTLTTSPDDAPGHAILRRQLDEVIAEQDERTQIRHTTELSQ